jgi:uncharacterized protein (UPF0335 family)
MDGKSTNGPVLATLVLLIDRCRTNADVFNRASEECTAKEVKSLLKIRAKDCTEAANKLVLEADRAGQQTNTLERDVKLLEACEKSEAVVRQAFAYAVEKNGLPDVVSEVVNKQYQALIDHHEQIKEVLKRLRDDVSDAARGGRDDTT